MPMRKMFNIMMWEDRVFLVELATFKPQTKEQCLELKYIRDNWFDKYGIIFLKEINEHFNSK